jgi:branched-chain amino acid transport system substrate-binding protein
VRRTSGYIMSSLMAAVAFLGGGLDRAWAAAEPYEINVVLPLTGGGSFLGETEQRSLQILEGVVNQSGGIVGRPLRFVFFDDQTSPQIAVQLASQILPSRPAVVIGSALVAMCNAMAPLMKNGPVLYCLSPGIHPASGGFVFTATIATRDGEEALVRYFKSRGWTRLAFIASTDATGHEAEEDLEAVLKRPENQAMELVASEHFNPTDVSTSAQMEHIKAAAPQVLLAWSTGGPVATLLKSAIQAGIAIPVATTNGNMTYRQMTQYAGFLPDELYLPSSLWLAQQQNLAVEPAVAQAQRRFFEAYKSADLEPDSPATLPWDPAMIIVAALRKLGPQASAAQLQEYLTHLKGFAGIHGVYNFEKNPQRGLDASDALVTQWSPAQHRWAIVSAPSGAVLPSATPK